jgi:hypothetical protein
MKTMSALLNYACPLMIAKTYCKYCSSSACLFTSSSDVCPPILFGKIGKIYSVFDMFLIGLLAFALLAF